MVVKGTCVRKNTNKFVFSLTKSYLCSGTVFLLVAGLL